MQAFERRISDIVEKGLEGNGLSRDEARELFEVPERTREAALIRWAGQELSLRAADGIAEIHGQIGLNSTKCPMDCGFCSFAKNATCRTDDFELTRDEVLRYAELHMQNKVNLLLLLCTASYRFDKLLGMAEAVRGEIPSDMPLLVNCDDLTLERCRQLKEVGVNGAYHAARMGEGRDTRIPIEKRVKTFERMQLAPQLLWPRLEPQLSHLLPGISGVARAPRSSRQCIPQLSRILNGHVRFRHSRCKNRGSCGAWSQPLIPRPGDMSPAGARGVPILPQLSNILHPSAPP